MENRKPSTELTREERIRDQMRHYPTLLKRWAGGTAWVLELTTSHATLTDDLHFVVRDTTSDAEILTEHVLGVYENAKPHHRMVVQRDN